MVSSFLLGCRTSSIYIKKENYSVCFNSLYYDICLCVFSNALVSSKIGNTRMTLASNTAKNAAYENRSKFLQLHRPISLYGTTTITGRCVELEQIVAGTGKN